MLKHTNICFLIFMLTQIFLLPFTMAHQNLNEKSVLQSQSARLQAMIEVDMATLSKYLADDLSYSHTNGSMENKAQFLATVEHGVINYVSATPRDVKVRIDNDIAIITGLADMRGFINDNPVSLTIRFLEVSRKVNYIWQLVAWQSVNYKIE